MSEYIYLITLGLPLATILAVFAMRYFATVQQARARLANDEAYRQIAEKAVALQAETAASLAAMQTTLAEVNTRVAAIETVLKAVE